MAEFALDDSYFDELAQWEQENAQRLAADTQNKRIKKTESLVSKVQQTEAFVKKLKNARYIYRAINIGTGITLYGLIFTFLIMNWQLLMSGVEGISMINGIGKIFNVKFVPALSILEFMILLMLWLAIIIIAGFLVTTVYYLDKCGVAGTSTGWALSWLPVQTIECAEFFK